MKESKKLVFFGTDRFSVPTLERLISDGRWEILAVVTQPDSKAGRGRKLSAPAVKHTAELAGIEVFQPAKVDEINEKLAGLGTAWAVLVAYGQIIPEATLAIFEGGIVNVHPSLLPKYRGPSPMEAAIVNGDRQTGLTLMRLSEGMDEGPIFAQKVIDLPGDIDKPNLAGQLANDGADFLVENLPAIVSGELQPKPQDEADASYTALLKKADGFINWQEPAETIERKVRAYLGFPRSRANLHGKEVIVTKARLAKSPSDGKLIMKCQPGWLEVTELVAPSGKTMSGEAFLRGLRS